MLKKSLFKLAAAAGLLVVSGLSIAAGSQSANVGVSATVSQNCTISATALTFGAYDPVVANATTALNAGNGTITVACTQSASGVTLGMGQGSNYSSANRMKGAVSGGFLPYTVYQPPNNTPGSACAFTSPTAWTATGTGLFSLSSPPSKAARTYNVCGTIAAGQDVPVDTYSDTVLATVNF